MGSATATDAELLTATDMASFECFYRRYFESVLGFFARRTSEAELAADLTAETFAAALAGRARYRPDHGRADSWLFAIAFHKLADSRRRGRADDRARRRLGMERVELTDEDLLRIERLAGDEWAGALIEQLAPDQRHAITEHVVAERSYADIARSLQISEVTVRKRVSRGLAIVRRQIGGRS
jgi:RNA polymerase sigma factor (sigma-70 family)